MTDRMMKPVFTTTYKNAKRFSKRAMAELNIRGVGFTSSAMAYDETSKYERACPFVAFIDTGSARMYFKGWK